MTVPQWFWFVDPVLRELAEANEPVVRRDIIDRAPRRMNLTEADRSEMAGRGRLTRVEDRAGWAIAYAGMAGLVKSPRRALWEITDEGRRLLAEHPSGISEAALSEVRRRAILVANASDDAVAPVSAPPVSDSAHANSSTPDERLRSAHAELRQSVAVELLGLVRAADPSFFEQLVLDLLHAMGYGATRDALTHVGGAGDGGFDGVVSLDRLGLEKVYVQAKRYAEDNSVGRPAIQGFLGALAGRRATKGVFLTTSRFSNEARDFARSASDSLVLLDGSQLAELMIEYGVGVSKRETFTLVSIDSDYFDEA